MLAGARLDKAIFIDTDFTEAFLNTTLLYRANLSGADLTEAVISYANLTDAYLHCADLNGADLTGADLTGADLTSADLSGANLTDTDLDGADFDGAKWPEGTPTPHGWKLGARSGRLQRAGTDPGPGESDQGNLLA